MACFMLKDRTGEMGTVESNLGKTEKLMRISGGFALTFPGRIKMAHNFKINIHRTIDNLYLRLMGDFDGSSAFELFNALKDKLVRGRL